jgi:DNA polymerase III epsilon subunit-like protein
MQLATGDAIALAALFLSLTTNIVGGLIWMRSADRKKFAAEREFLHVKNGIIDLSKNLDILFQDLENDRDVMKRDLFKIMVYLGIESIKDKDN